MPTPPVPFCIADPTIQSKLVTTTVGAGSKILLDVNVVGGGGPSTVTANQGTPAATASAWPIKLTDGTDTADITAASALKVDGSAVTQPISAAALPLPALAC